MFAIRWGTMLGTVLVSLAVGPQGLATAQEDTPPYNAAGICNAILRQTENRNEGPNPVLLALAVAQLQPEYDSLDDDLDAAEIEALRETQSVQTLATQTQQVLSAAQRNPQPSNIQAQLLALTAEYRSVVSEVSDLGDVIEDLEDRAEQLALSCAAGAFDIGSLETQLNFLTNRLHQLLTELADIAAIIQQIDNLVP